MKTARRHARHRSLPGPPATAALASVADPDDRPCTPSQIFEALWQSLADVIGPTATAALLQRSVKRASAQEPGLDELVIARDQFAYKYTLPSSWSRATAESAPAIKQVLRHLWPLLSELTGPVVVRRLEQDPFLRRCGVIPEDAGE